MRLINDTYKMLAVLLAALLLGAACQEFDVPTPGGTGGVTYNADGTLGLTLNIAIPGLVATTQTRSLGETPDYQNLKLYLLVFEGDDGLEQYEELTPVTPGQTDATHGHNDLLTYKLSLRPTEKPATIHLIATNQPEFERQISYGTEERVIFTLATGYDYPGETAGTTAYEAYWQRIALDYNIPSAEQADPGNQNTTDPNKAYSEEAARHAADLAEKMKHVPLVRNFCSVSVEVPEDVKEHFTLKGLYVFNTVDAGTVAPYVASRPEGDRFVDYVETENGRYAIKSYSKISSQGHIGTLPAGVRLINKIDEGENVRTKSLADAAGRVAPVCFYERPARVNSTERTYAIVRGRYDKDAGDSYYKIDLGDVRRPVNETDPDMGIFEYYNLLRGFDYAITLNKVGSSGYASLAEAASGPVYNNFAASVEARSMTSISDGVDMIFVSFTSYVFTHPGDTVHLYAQYRTDLNTVKGGTIKNELLNLWFEAGGAVIEKVEEEDGEGDRAEWKKYIVTGKDLSILLKEQQLYIYCGNKAGSGEAPDYGLYRVINFYSREPWTFEHMDTFPDLWDLWEGDEDDATVCPWDWSESMRQIGEERDAPLTLFFELPEGLPQAIFPLEFAIETDRQNIQNALEGNAVVRSVPPKESLFATHPTLGNPPEAPTTSRIQYVKTVTWEKYNGSLDEESTAEGNRIVRCRFRTITDLKDENVGDGGTEGVRSQTMLRVSNPYFGSYVKKNPQDESSTEMEWVKYQEDGFIRSTIKEYEWNFTDKAWNNYLTTMNSRYDREPRYRDYDNFYTATNNNTEGLILIDGKVDTTVSRLKFNLRQGLHEEATTLEKPTLLSGTTTVDGQTYRFVETTSGTVAKNQGKYKGNDMFRRQVNYDGNEDRTLEVWVVATDLSGNPVPPKIEFDVTKGSGTVTQKNDPVRESKAQSDKAVPYDRYVFQYTVPRTVERMNMNIMATSENPGMRFYKIGFTPWKQQ